ncbi:24-hydroxycholesterol 7-alpha-hydroxylase-like [Arapaima gigas]
MDGFHGSAFEFGKAPLDFISGAREKVPLCMPLAGQRPAVTNPVLLAGPLCEEFNRHLKLPETEGSGDLTDLVR